MKIRMIGMPTSWVKIENNFNLQGKIAFVPQQAWILNATVKENITLGEPFDQRWYETCIETCALKLDLNGFPDGDLTEIGEKVFNEECFEKKIDWYESLRNISLRVLIWAVVKSKGLA